MKIHIEGEGNDEDIIAIAKFFKNRWHGRLEHVNVFIEEGTETMATSECIQLMKKIWEDKNEDNI